MLHKSRDSFISLNVLNNLTCIDKSDQNAYTLCLVSYVPSIMTALPLEFPRIAFPACLILTECTLPKSFGITSLKNRFHLKMEAPAKLRSVDSWWLLSCNRSSFILSSSVVSVFSNAVSTYFEHLIMSRNTPITSLGPLV